MLRTRNAFVLKARGDAKQHALAVQIHIRPHEVEHFNNNSKVQYPQHVWTLLDADTDFQTIVLSLEEDKKLESLMSKSACTKWKAMTSPLVLMQWQAMVVTGHGYSNVLNRTLKPRSDCFVQSSNDDQASGVTKKTKASQEPPPPPTYVGGMFSPMPMRKIVISVWIYPPDVVLPPIGEPIPENDEAVTDFFLSNE